jgi:proteasome lid subunit RPN8/RPN11
MSPYHLRFRDWRRLRRRSYQAQQRNQSEVCGIIAADKDRNIVLLFLKNESEKRWSFKFNSDQYGHARKEFRGRKLRFIGEFHSHPVSYAIPGPRDILSAHVGKFELIYDVCGQTARLWKIARLGNMKAAVEQPLSIQRTAKKVTNALASKSPKLTEEGRRIEMRWIQGWFPKQYRRKIKPLSPWPQP